MRRELLACLTTSLMVGALLPVGAAGHPPAAGPGPAASAPGGSRPPATRLAPPGGGTIDPGLLAAIHQPTQPVMAILEMGGAPLTIRRTSSGQPLSRAAATSAHAAMVAAEAALLPRIAGLGGRIIGTMIDAYDGIQVQALPTVLAALAKLPGVVAVHAVNIYRRENVRAVPYVQAPVAWAAGETGAGETIGLIDTGIDFYHADFDGSGDPADFAYGAARDTVAPAFDADGTTRAFPNAKVIGGTDFAGDAYDALTAGHTTPVPDANPLDCGLAAGGDGHGTHTAGSAAGQGVLADGSTYSGPYDAATLGNHAFAVGPGVAPEATIREYRIFGCTGSTALVTLAIDRAVSDGVDVISLSLGSAWGTASADDPAVAAANDAAAAGIVVVAASGNDGDFAYLTATPASATRAISVAALDAAGIDPDNQAPARFSSAGPRTGDSGFKPDITAPGVDIVSAGVGTGDAGVEFSGTSMATPMVAGAAALVLQGHPSWTDAETRADRVKAALMATADFRADAHGTLTGDAFRVGAGVLDAGAAAAATVLVTTSDHSQALAFGYQPLSGAWTAHKSFTVTNSGGAMQAYTVGATAPLPASLGLVVTVNGGSPTVTVPTGGSVSVDLGLSLSAAAVTALPSVDDGASGSMPEASGHVTLTPTTPATGVGPLQVAWTVVPRGTSAIAPAARSAYQSFDTVALASSVLRDGGIHAGAADVYAWGLHASDQAPGSGADVRDVGVQVLPGDYLGGASSDRSVVFAISTYGSASTAAANVYEIDITTGSATSPNFTIIAADYGLLTEGTPEGQLGVAVLDADGDLVSPIFAADAPPNGSVVELPVLASTLGLADDSSRFRYAVVTTDGFTGQTDQVPGSAVFDPYDPAISSGDYLPLGPAQNATLGLAVDTQLILATPALGWLVATLDDANGPSQADEIPLGRMAHRLSGPDRYATASTISRYTYQPGVAAVFAVSGANFPDGLSAGPAAAALGAPIVLVPPTGAVPAGVMAELRRLRPQHIYITGSIGAVSAGVATTLAALAPVSRLAGSDRYATAAAIATTIFGTVLGHTSLPVIYVASGALFPDALTAGPAAARQGGALLLVPPTGTLPATIASALATLKPARLVIVGGPSAVSAAMMAQLAHYAPSVSRLAGTDRYLTGVAISKAVFGPGVPAVYLASGANFPDAMAGAAAAGLTRGPVLLVAPTAYEQPVLAEMQRLRPTALYVLGGPSSVGDAVVDAFSPYLAP